MSKLIERLDGLQLVVAKAEYDAVTDERMDTHDNFEFIYSLAAAYPKLRAVVEAAEAVHLHVIPNDNAASGKLTKLQDALSALEEDV